MGGSLFQVEQRFERCQTTRYHRHGCFHCAPEQEPGERRLALIAIALDNADYRDSDDTKTQSKEDDQACFFRAWEIGPHDQDNREDHDYSS